MKKLLLFAVVPLDDGAATAMAVGTVNTPAALQKARPAPHSVMSSVFSQMLTCFSSQKWRSPSAIESAFAIGSPSRFAFAARNSSTRCFRLLNSSISEFEPLSRSKLDLQLDCGEQRHSGELRLNLVA
ncbi:hypothetical protein B2M20_00690 [Nitrobacter vulgaris]|uniref:Uncharacterized protein n=1 Tax=Nitrobacter vulgaris TaxID=29421 RepID=A0A1V4I330_NITVU|nr:hypothetical protein B2M20_00690 [Nitrobacter vulgaris]